MVWTYIKVKEKIIDIMEYLHIGEIIRKNFVAQEIDDLV